MMTTKLYQIDTYLKEWDARILAAKPAPEVPGDSAKQPKPWEEAARRKAAAPAQLRRPKAENPAGSDASPHQTAAGRNKSG